MPGPGHQGPTPKFHSRSGTSTPGMIACDPHVVNFRVIAIGSQHMHSTEDCISLLATAGIGADRLLQMHLDCAGVRT